MGNTISNPEQLARRLLRVCRHPRGYWAWLLLPIALAAAVTVMLVTIKTDDPIFENEKRTPQWVIILSIITYFLSFVGLMFIIMYKAGCKSTKYETKEAIAIVSRSPYAKNKEALQALITAINAFTQTSTPATAAALKSAAAGVAPADIKSINDALYALWQQRHRH